MKGGNVVNMMYNGWLSWNGKLRPNHCKHHHTYTRKAHCMALQKMAFLANACWRLQWVGPNLHFQVNRSFLGLTDKIQHFTYKYICLPWQSASLEQLFVRQVLSDPDIANRSVHRFAACVYILVVPVRLWWITGRIQHASICWWEEASSVQVLFSKEMLEKSERHCCQTGSQQREGTMQMDICGL